MLAAQPSAKVGVWTVTMQSSKTFSLTDPTGTVVATAQPIGGFNTAPRTLGFTVSSGGATGDTFAVTVQPYRILGVNLRSPIMAANIAAGWPFDYVANCGVSSDTSTFMLARFGTGTSADPMTWPNVHVWILASPITNDQNAGIPLSTSISNVKQMVAKLQSMGAVVIIPTVPLQSAWTGASFAQYRANVSGWNRWVVAYTRVTPGTYSWNASRSVTNPATGTFYAAGEFATGAPSTTADGTHFNYFGGALASRPLAQIFSVIQPVNDPTDSSLFNTATGYFGNSILAGSSSPSAGAVNTSGAYIGSSNVTGTAVANMTSINSRGSGACTATKTALSGQYTDQAQTVTLNTSAALDGCAIRFGGDYVNTLGRWDLVHAASTAYNIGDKRLPEGTSAATAFAGLEVMYTAAGTSAATAPTYPVIPSGTVTDGTATITMLNFPGAIARKSSYYISPGVAGTTPGATIYPAYASAFYFQPMATCQTASTEPTAAYTAITAAGQTLTDGTCTMTAITPPTYAFTATLDYTLSGMTAGKGVALSAELGGINTLGSNLELSGQNPVYGLYTDLSGVDSPFSQWLPASGTIKVFPFVFGFRQQVRYFFLESYVQGDAGQTGIVYSLLRPRIQAGFPAPRGVQQGIGALGEVLARVAHVADVVRVDAGPEDLEAGEHLLRCVVFLVH